MQLPPFRIVRVITFSLLACASAASFGGTLESWKERCKASPEVVERTGAIDLADIDRGMTGMAGTGVVPVLGNLAVEEACLSVIASGEVGQPVVVVFAGVSDETRNAVSATGIARLRSFYEREHLAERLATLGINLYSQRSGDKHRDRVYANRAVLAGGVDHQRSFAAVGKNLCVISLRPNPMASYVENQQPYVWSMLGAGDREAVVQSGSAWEFWHEVGHCAPEKVANLLSGTSESGSQLGQWNERKLAGMDSCRPESAAKLWEKNVGRKFRHAKSLSDLKGTPDPAAMNRFIHYELIKESLADRFSERVVSVRLTGDTLSCKDPNQVEHPWYVLRLAWSVRDPDARYMTWLTPWLSNKDESLQHQVLVDAHEGLMTLAAKRLPKPLVMEIQNSRHARPDKHRITDPAGSPSPDAVEQWAAWVDATLDSAAEQIGTSGD